MCLRDLVVLTIDAAQVAVAEENISRAVRAGERRLFAEMGGVGRNDRQATRIAGGDFIPQTIIQAVTRADGAAFQQRLERGYSLSQLPVRSSRE